MTKPTQPIHAWHFTGAKLRDGRAIPKPGKRLIHRGELVICQTGLHGSIRLIDALQFAPGAMLHRTKHSGSIIQQDDKLCSSVRVIEWSMDATPNLRLFARQCALDVAHLWDMPQVVRQYLETGDKALRAAAAHAAADAVTYTYAAASATYAAASSIKAAAHAYAAYAAAASSIKAAAHAYAAAAIAANANVNAAAVTVNAAARDAQNTRLETLVMEAHNTLA